jgi:hypothetical protein
MAAAMFLPVLPLLALYWSGVISTSMALVLEMALMMPAMVGLMLYRADEYSAPHSSAHLFHARRLAHH